MPRYLVPILIAGCLALSAGASFARPEYARKENKMCGYCHVNPNGGGSRNPRGVFYAMHNHTFDGYDEAKVMGADPTKRSGPPAYHSAWKVDAPVTTRRIVVADVMDDHTPRLLLLNDHNVVGVYKLNGTKLDKEDEVDMSDGAPKFVAGHFAKGKPAILAAPGMVAFRADGKFVRKPTPDVTELTGYVRYWDGTENYFIYQGGGVPQSYAVDTAAAKPVIDGKEMSDPSGSVQVYSEITIHPGPELLTGIGLPDAATKSGVAGIYAPRSDGKLYTWAPWLDADGSSSIHVSEFSGFGGQGGDQKAAWTSPKLAGKVLDISLGSDPKNPMQPGLYVLEATGDGGMARTVEFFALD